MKVPSVAFAKIHSRKVKPQYKTVVVAVKTVTALINFLNFDPSLLLVAIMPAISRAADKPTIIRSISSQSNTPFCPTHLNRTKHGMHTVRVIARLHINPNIVFIMNVILQ